MEIRPVPVGAIEPAVVAAYERALAAVDRPDFERAVEAVLPRVVPSARFFMYEAEGEAAPELRVARYERQIAPIMGRYLRHYRADDPVMEAVERLGPSGVVLLKVAPEDIRQEGFRDQFFHAQGIVERLSLVQRTGTGWRGMNISRNADSGRCSDDEISRFVALAQLLLPMMSRHCARLTATLPARSAAPEMEKRFAERYPELTRREREVCARAAIGMSVEGTSLDLAIAVTSVLTYRRRAYARLSVSSPYELAALVMR